jgi:2,4-dienoyl-CoA reductase-like NADH-dependent reductase (Old Yellow Enzyme family)
MVQPLGVDLIDCSSGAVVPGVHIPTGTGYQTSFAMRVKQESGVLSGAVGLITSATQADHIVRTGQADLVLLARAMLREPYWANQAAQQLKQPGHFPAQYKRAAE